MRTRIALVFGTALLSTIFVSCKRTGGSASQGSREQAPPVRNAARTAGQQSKADIDDKVAPAVATNNRMVVKPTELTPMTALVLADILYEAGLPPQMLSVVTGMPADIGAEMITNPDIELITFTGGVPVGKLIANTAGYRRQVLELGGNDPIIVMEDADLEQILRRSAGILEIELAAEAAATVARRSRVGPPRSHPDAIATEIITRIARPGARRSSCRCATYGGP